MPSKTDVGQKSSLNIAGFLAFTPNKSAKMAPPSQVIGIISPFPMLQM
jgi:hypothetical protein